MGKNVGRLGRIINTEAFRSAEIIDLCEQLRLISGAKYRARCMKRKRRKSPIAAASA